jgi:hypothetical protein
MAGWDGVVRRYGEWRAVQLMAPQQHSWTRRSLESFCSWVLAWNAGGTTGAPLAGRGGVATVPRQELRLSVPQKKGEQLW